jgi:signal transduction histidine kinase
VSAILFKNFRKTIIPPLMVMLLLTVLVGVTACEQALRWEQGIQQVVNNIAQRLIRNNVRNELKSIQQNLEKPEETVRTWREIQRESRMLYSLLQKSDNASGSVFRSTLEYILKIKNPTPEQLEMLLANPFFQFRVYELDELNELQENSRKITIMVTLSMVGLGLLLMLVTARDLDRLFRQLTRSRDLNIQIQEKERHRIAQELHDGVVQELIDLKRNYQPEKIDQLLHNLRRVCHNLKPQVLDDLGLPSAIEFLVDDLRRNGSLKVDLYLDHEELSRLPKSYELPIFRVVQELCSNIKHHANATEVSVRILYNPQESPLLRGYVTDNGCGFESGNIISGKMGLTGIQERIRQVDGHFKMESTLNKGSQFQWMIPVKTSK